MKRLIVAALLACTLAVSAPVPVHAQAEPEADIVGYTDAFSNPLRLAYYFVYPVGFTMEWVIMRPLHYLFSRPYNSRFFGYTPIGHEGTYEKMGEHM